MAIRSASARAAQATQDPMQGVERLSIVSKVLFDSRLVELRRENEALKLKNFWLQHDDLQMKMQLARVNECDNGPKCRCESCFYFGRFENVMPQRLVVPHVNCTFIPWFENEIMQFGLTSSVVEFFDVGHDLKKRAHLTTHFAIIKNSVEEIKVGGQIKLAPWFMEIATCEHPEHRKIHELFCHFSRIAGLGVFGTGTWESYWAV